MSERAYFCHKKQKQLYLGDRISTTETDVTDHWEKGLYEVKQSYLHETENETKNNIAKLIGVLAFAEASNRKI